MGVVSKITKRIDVPGEEGHWIEIRMLSWITLDKSKKERIKEVAGMSGLFAMLRDITPTAADAARSAADKDPLQGYDRLVLLRHGVASWSYGDVVDVEDFEGPTAEWAAREILAYTRPDEQQSKTNSSPSTGT